MNFHALHILNKNFCTSYLLCVGNKTDFLTNTEFERKNKVNNVIIQQNHVLLLPARSSSALTSFIQFLLHCIHQPVHNGCCFIKYPTSILQSLDLGFQMSNSVSKFRDLSIANQWIFDKLHVVIIRFFVLWDGWYQ